jgi:hypothetical protein
VLCLIALKVPNPAQLAIPESVAAFRNDSGDARKTLFIASEKRTVIDGPSTKWHFSNLSAGNRLRFMKSVARFDGNCHVTWFVEISTESQRKVYSRPRQ